MCMPLDVLGVTALELLSCSFLLLFFVWFVWFCGFMAFAFWGFYLFFKRLFCISSYGLAIF